MSKHRYSLSFTAASFRLNDFMKFAEFYADTPGRINREDVDADKVLGAGMQKTNQRIVTELVKRYNALTPVQRELMIEGDFDEKKQLCYLAIAKSNLLTLTLGHPNRPPKTSHRKVERLIYALV